MLLFHFSSIRPLTLSPTSIIFVGLAAILGSTQGLFQTLYLVVQSARGSYVVVGMKSKLTT